MKRLRIAFEGRTLISPRQMERIYRQLPARAPVELVLNLEGLTYMNSRGIRLLVELKIEMERRGGRLVLVNVSYPIENLLRQVKLHEFFELAGSEDVGQ